MAFKSWYGIDVAMASYGISVTTPCLPKYRTL